MYEYKTVPCARVLQVKSNKDDEATIRAFANLMNAEAVNGWEFCSMETITIHQPSGCLSFFQKERQTAYNMMVFRREVAEHQQPRRSRREEYPAPDDRYGY